MSRRFLLFNGYTQGDRTRTGLGQVATELHSRGEKVQLYSWREPPKPLAAALKRNEGDRLIIAGYSYGGYTAVNLCWELCRMGLQVGELILLDAVYRLWNRLASIRSLRHIWSIQVPTNVSLVTSWRQAISLPAGHKVVVDHRHTTLDSRTLLVPHHKVDQDEGIREYILSR